MENQHFALEHLQAQRDMAEFLRLEVDGKPGEALEFLRTNPAMYSYSALFRTLVNLVREAYEADPNELSYSQWLIAFRDAVDAATPEVMQMAELEDMLNLEVSDE